jgi:hypothetical protein
VPLIACDVLYQLRNRRLRYLNRGWRCSKILEGSVLQEAASMPCEVQLEPTALSPLCFSVAVKPSRCKKVACYRTLVKVNIEHFHLRPPSQQTQPWLKQGKLTEDSIAPDLHTISNASRLSPNAINLSRKQTRSFEVKVTGQ